MSLIQRDAEDRKNDLEVTACIREQHVNTRGKSPVLKYDGETTKEKAEERIEAFRKIVREHQYQPIRWIKDRKRRSVTVDATTASIVCSVYDAIHDANKTFFASFDPSEMVRVAFKLTSKS